MCGNSRFCALFQAIAAIRAQCPSSVIIGLDKVPFKLEVAALAGANHTFLVDGAAAERVKALTDHRGPDVYFECTVSDLKCIGMLDFIFALQQIVCPNFYSASMTVKPRCLLVNAAERFPYHVGMMPKFWTHGSMCCACADVTKNIKYFLMGPKLRHPAVGMMPIKSDAVIS